VVDCFLEYENMDSLEEPETNTKGWQNSLILIILAASIALILWLTLFSRLGSYSRHFLPPLWSYRAIMGAVEELCLEYHDAGKEKYFFLTPDVGAVGLSTRVRTLIGICPGSKGRYYVRPAVYREDN